MSSLKDNKTCALLEQYLSYLIIIKGRSPLTIEEYRVDCAMLFEFIKRKRGVSEEEIICRNFSDVDIDFIKSITVADLYEFITYCGEVRKVTTATRARKDAPVIGVIVLIALIFQIIISPFEAIANFFKGDDLAKVESLQQDYGYLQNLGFDSDDYLEGSGTEYRNVIFKDGQTEVVLALSFVLGVIVGNVLFNDLFLAVTTGVCFLPLPYLYLEIKTSWYIRHEAESLENSMSIITNAYVGCDDIQKAFEIYVQEEKRYSIGKSPFAEFISEILYINPNIERGLLILSEKVNNGYFSQWVKMLILCHHDRRLKFALRPIIDSMNDAKSIQTENETVMMRIY